MTEKLSYPELEDRVKALENEAVIRQQTIQESETRYRSFVENFHGIAYQGDLGSTPAFFHGDVEAITGYTEQAFLSGRPQWEQIIHKQDALTIREAIVNLPSTSKGKAELEYRIIRKDGQIRWVRELVRLIRNHSPTPIHIQGVLYDITDRKNLEAQYQQAQKMKAIAALAGGIAHEYNNALSGITGNIDLIRLYYAEDKRINRYVEPMCNSARRMERLTHQLLAYALGGKYEASYIALNQLIEKTLPIIINTIDPALRVETDLGRQIPDIKADGTQIQMVLSAVISNAVEAVNGNGLIQLHTRQLTVGEAFVRSHQTLTSGQYVCFTVEDNGKGMDKDTKARIFEPFFSTKFLGRGLGMAAAYGIVKNHAGWISVKSEMGRGTNIHIYLPAGKVPPKGHKIRQLRFPWG